MTAEPYVPHIPDFLDRPHIQPFGAMAERLARNQDAEFGGAMVLVPPGASEPIVMLILDPTQDLGHFLSSAMTKLEIALNSFKESQAPNNYGRR